MTTPFTITVVRTRKRQPLNRSSAGFRRLRRDYFGNQSIRWFVIELFLFALLVALSAWPMKHALDALRLL